MQIDSIMNLYGVLRTPFVETRHFLFLSSLALSTPYCHPGNTYRSSEQFHTAAHVVPGAF